MADELYRDYGKNLSDEEKVMFDQLVREEMAKMQTELRAEASAESKYDRYDDPGYKYNAASKDEAKYFDSLDRGGGQGAEGFAYPKDAVRASKDPYDQDFKAGNVVVRGGNGGLQAYARAEVPPSAQYAQYGAPMATKEKVVDAYIPMSPGNEGGGFGGSPVDEKALRRQKQIEYARLLAEDQKSGTGVGDKPSRRSRRSTPESGPGAHSSPQQNIYPTGPEPHMQPVQRSPGMQNRSHLNVFDQGSADDRMEARNAREAKLEQQRQYRQALDEHVATKGGTPVNAGDTFARERSRGLRKSTPPTQNSFAIGSEFSDGRVSKREQQERYHRELTESASQQAIPSERVSLRHKSAPRGAVVRTTSGFTEDIHQRNPLDNLGSGNGNKDQRKAAQREYARQLTEDVQASPKTTASTGPNANMRKMMPQSENIYGDGMGAYPGMSPYGAGSRSQSVGNRRKSGYFHDDAEASTRRRDQQRAYAAQLQEDALKKAPVMSRGTYGRRSRTDETGIGAQADPNSNAYNTGLRVGADSLKKDTAERNREKQQEYAMALARDKLAPEIAGARAPYRRGSGKVDIEAQATGLVIGSRDRGPQATEQGVYQSPGPGARLASQDQPPAYTDVDPYADKYDPKEAAYRAQLFDRDPAPAADDGYQYEAKGGGEPDGGHRAGYAAYAPPDIDPTAPPSYGAPYGAQYGGPPSRSKYSYGGGYQYAEGSPRNPANLSNGGGESGGRAASRGMEPKVTVQEKYYGGQMNPGAGTKFY